MAKVLCVAAHPDDEVLMCGGSLAKHALAGDEVRILVIADGVSSRDVVAIGAFYARLAMSSKASDILGANGECLGLPDNKLDTLPRLTLIKKIEYVVNEFKPDVVYTHWHGDMNIDHRVVSDATKVACRPAPGFTVKTLLMGEVPSSTDWAGGFNPNWFVSIDKEAAIRKMAALNEYEEEMRDELHPRSIAGILCLAELRGRQIGVEHAEAFEVVRNVL